MNCTETVIQLNLFILHSLTDLHCLWPHIHYIAKSIGSPPFNEINYLQINYLPAGGDVGVGELEVSPVMLYTKLFTNTALSDIICKMT